MIPLNKINDPDKVLPTITDIGILLQRLAQSDCGDNSCMFSGRGKVGMRTNGGCRCYQDYRYKIIDQYNQVMIDGDVERLARLIHANRSVESWETCSVGDRDSACTEAEEYIANLDKFLVLKKRLIEK